MARMDLTGHSKLLFKQPGLDIFSMVPSPDGHSLAFGPVSNNGNAWTIAAFPGK